MSYSYNRYETQRRQRYGASSNRTTLGYWVPLAITVTVATIGLVAWVWHERRNDEEDYDDRPDNRPPPGYGGLGPGPNSFMPGPAPQGPLPQGLPPQGLPPQGPPPPGPAMRSTEQDSMMSRMSGALRRTPSPQQIIDGASRTVQAGVAAAGAAVGGALSSIREEDKTEYEDHSRWSEEAETRHDISTSQGGSGSRDAASAGQSTLGRQGGPIKPSLNDKRKSVAIVVSANNKHHGPGEEEEIAYLEEHASILSHLPEHIDADVQAFILIYAPDLQQHPLSGSPQPGKPIGSISSSYSNIAAADLSEADKPLSTIDPNPIASSPDHNYFNKLYSQARGLVENETMIMPFTTPTGYVQILRHIGPEVVYVQESLSGPGGDAIIHISGWVGQVLLVVGDESGHGGLVDSEDERGHSSELEESKWWKDSPRIGLGKGIEVVEGLRVGEDWRRRVRGHD